MIVFFLEDKFSYITYFWSFQQQHHSSLAYKTWLHIRWLLSKNKTLFTDFGKTGSYFPSDFISGCSVWTVWLMLFPNQQIDLIGSWCNRAQELVIKARQRPENDATGARWQHSNLRCFYCCAAILHATSDFLFTWTYVAIIFCNNTTITTVNREVPLTSTTEGIPP